MGIDEKSSDSGLIRRVLEGDENAFRVLFDRYYVRLFSFVYQKLDNWHDTEVVVQETFIRVFQHLDELQDVEKFQSWLFSIAHRRYVDMHRENQKRVGDISLSYIAHDEAKGLEVTAVIEHRAVQQHVGNCDLEDKLLTLIAQLPDLERSLLLLRKDGMSYKKIAQKLKVTEGTVRNRLHRAKSKLKNWMCVEEVL